MRYGHKVGIMIRTDIKYKREYLESGDRIYLIKRSGVLQRLHHLGHGIYRGRKGSVKWRILATAS